MLNILKVKTDVVLDLGPLAKGINDAKIKTKEAAAKMAKDMNITVKADVTQFTASYKQAQRQIEKFESDRIKAAAKIAEANKKAFGSAVGKLTSASWTGTKWGLGVTAAVGAGITAMVGSQLGRWADQNALVKKTGLRASDQQALSKVAHYNDVDMNALMAVMKDLSVISQFKIKPAVKKGLQQLGIDAKELKDRNPLENLKLLFAKLEDLDLGDPEKTLNAKIGIMEKLFGGSELLNLVGDKGSRTFETDFNSRRKSISPEYDSAAEKADTILDKVDMVKDKFTNAIAKMLMTGDNLKKLEDFFTMLGKFVSDTLQWILDNQETVKGLLTAWAAMLGVGVAVQGAKKVWEILKTLKDFFNGIPAFFQTLAALGTGWLVKSKFALTPPTPAEIRSRMGLPPATPGEIPSPFTEVSSSNIRSSTSALNVITGGHPRRTYTLENATAYQKWSKIINEMWEVPAVKWAAKWGGRINRLLNILLPIQAADVAMKGTFDTINNATARGGWFGMGGGVDPSRALREHKPLDYKFPLVTPEDAADKRNLGTGTNELLQQIAQNTYDNKVLSQQQINAIEYLKRQLGAVAP